MKIVCDSCGAKYSIADEKVAGRVFKIRCKKCGAAIVVRGDQSASGSGEAGAASAGQAAGGFDYGGEAVWHVVVEGEQQGPFTPVQLGQMISASTIGWDAYVWREGFEDWKPAQDIEELVQQIMNPGGSAAPEEQADPFAQSGPAPAKKAATAPAKDAGADLFAQSESPFAGGGFGGDEDDVVASAPSPRVGSTQAMTGQRNENSVLFSLSNLQALATGGSGGSAAPSIGGGAKSGAPAAKAGMAAGEGSGLIDIRALAGATGLGGPMPASSGSASPARVDDLLSIGTASPGLGAPLAAPVIIPERKESGGGRGVIIGGAIVGIGLVAAASIFAVVVMNNQPDPATLAAAAAGAPAAGALAPGAVAAPGTSLAAGTIGAPGTAAPGTVGSPPSATPPGATPPGTPAGGTAAPGPTPPAASATEPEERGGGGGSRRPRGGGGGGATASGGAGGSAAAESPATGGGGGGGGGARGGGGGASPRGGGGGGNDSIDALLEGALSGGGGGRRSAGGGGGGGTGGGGGAAADSSLPETPPRAAVQSALNAVQGAVSACGQGQHGMATVAITVSGSTGRVTGANVTGQFAGTPVGSCVARAVRGATFPRFQRATMIINYPFRI